MRLIWKTSTNSNSVASFSLFVSKVEIRTIHVFLYSIWKTLQLLKKYPFIFKIWRVINLSLIYFIVRCHKWAIEAIQDHVEGSNKFSKVKIILSFSMRLRRVKFSGILKFNQMKSKLRFEKFWNKGHSINTVKSTNILEIGKRVLFSMQIFFFQEYSRLLFHQIHSRRQHCWTQWALVLYVCACLGHVNDGCSHFDFPIAMAGEGAVSPCQPQQGMSRVAMPSLWSARA